jgi:hypothetical protein
VALALVAAVAAPATAGGATVVTKQRIAAKGGASGQTTAAPDPNGLRFPPEQNRAPVGFVRTAEQVIAIANLTPQVRDTKTRHRVLEPTAYMKGPARWQVSYFGGAKKAGGQGKELVQVIVDDRTGRVTEAWTGFQVAWSMARGYDGAFGRKVNALFVWIPLCVLFVLPFVDPRRWRRMLHLDLLMLVGALSVSLAYFNQGKIGVSVPLVYPPLVYLLVRLLWIGFARAPRRKRGQPPDPVRLLVPVAWLAVGLVFLVGFRIGLNVTNSNVIDVGYAGVIGADRVVDGKPMYGGWPHDNEHGDTYGPVAYYTYVPFEQAFPWSGRWDDLPAAHAAAVAFDLFTLLLLFLLGRRVRGPSLGIALAYAWAACPWTMYVLMCNTNDTLVAAFVTLILLLSSRPVLRGGALALAALTKFAPLALGPLVALHREPGERFSLKRVLLVTAAFAVAAAAFLALPLTDVGGHKIWDRTITYQNNRGSPFSLWGIAPSLTWLQTPVQIFAVALAFLLALFPRGGRDLPAFAALAGAVLIAAQLGVTHWFYLYVPWFLPALFLALLGDGVLGRGEVDRGGARVTAAEAPSAAVAASA